MNVSIRMGHVNDLSNIKGKDFALSETLNFIQHWKRDVEGNVMPTIGSLQHVETTIRAALAVAAE